MNRFLSLNMMNESSKSPLKFSAKIKRKPIDKENQNTFKTLTTKSKRLCLGSLSTNIESCESITRYSELCLSQSSQDSHDSGFSNFSQCQSHSQSSPCQSSPSSQCFNESIGVEADMDMLNEVCLQSSASNNRILNFINSPSSPMPTRRCLFTASPSIQTPKTPNQILFNDDSYTTKPDAPKRNITPVSINRQMIPNTMDSPSFSSAVEQSISSIQKMLERTSTEPLPASLHEQHEQIKQSLDIECQTSSSSESKSSSQRLIGDRSTYHILPTTTSIKHNDLSVITTETMQQVLRGDYNSDIESVTIVDSRYPYEFEGGHIQNAENLYTREKIYDKFLQTAFLKKASEQAAAKGKRTVIVFHCEFSSERGPSMLRFLRNQDRTINKDSYPKLFYPEIYLLEGGYKAFYESDKTLCEPNTYKPMLHVDHVHDLKHFRAKTKTWNRTSSNCVSSNKSSFKSRLQRFPRSTLF